MKTFTLYWRTGVRETIKGDSFKGATILAGYSKGTLRALYCHTEGDDNSLTWNPTSQAWEEYPVAESGHAPNE